MSIRQRSSMLSRWVSRRRIAGWLPAGPSERLHFRLLGSSDAASIARLERDLHRPQSLSGRDRIASELREAELGDSNLSLGFYDGFRLVGVILAYVLPQSTREKPAGETSPGVQPGVVYLADLAIQKGYRQHLVEFVSRFTDLAREHCPGVAIEAHSLEPEMRLWRYLVRESRGIGLHLTDVEPLGEEVGGLSLYWVRWELTGTCKDLARALPEAGVHEIEGERYVLRVIRCTHHWDGIRERWDALLARTPGATALQSHAYLRAWWRCFGNAQRLWILTFWRESELVGVIPMQRICEPWLLGFDRRLCFLGSRWEVDRPTLLFGEQQRLGERLLVEYLHSAQSDWDEFHAYEQPEGCSLVGELARLAGRQRYLLSVTADSSCPFLDLTGTFAEYFGARSRAFRKRMRAAHRKLANAGSLDLVRTARWPEVREAFESYLELEARSWKSGTGAAVSGGTRQGFYEALVAEAGPSGCFHVVSLRLDGRWIAATLAFVHERRYYSLQITHDAAYAAYSPGTVLEYLELQDCFDSDLIEYDFLGGFLSNKQRWSATWRETEQLYIRRRTPRSLARFVWKSRLLPRLKAGLERLGVLDRALRWHGRAKDAIEGWRESVARV